MKAGKHVLCEAPLAFSASEYDELFQLAEDKHLVLMESIKTAYVTAYKRLILLALSGKIGRVLSVDVTCTSMSNFGVKTENEWNSICAWGPTALLPIFQLLGTDYSEKRIVSWIIDEKKHFDGFTKMDFLYKNAVASAKVAKAAKSEGELIITGTKGYIYVPAPWWKTDYFEIRFEDPGMNKRYFYQFDGEGLRYEILEFVRMIESKSNNYSVRRNVSKAIGEIIGNHNMKSVQYIEL